MKEIRGLLLQFYNNKWIKFFAIPFILLLFWIGSSLLLNSYVSFTTLTKNYDIHAITTMPQGKLLKDESITGEFTAVENDLGILSVRFADHDSVNYNDQDILLFRIKEKGAETWQYQNSYKSNAISGMPLYPFGFPEFANSQGKTYVFSLTSLRGDKENAVQLSQDGPILVSKYVFTKSELFANKKFLMPYLIKKLINSFNDTEFFESSLIFGLPLFFYLLWLGLYTRISGRYPQALFIVPFSISLMISLNIDLVTGIFFGIIILWIIIISILKVESSISFFFAFLFFILAFVFVLVGDQDTAGRLSNWIYMFLLIGALQLLWELKNLSNSKAEIPDTEPVGEGAGVNARTR